MNEPLVSPVIAIDGGGTQCRLALNDGKSIVAVETGSANVSTDFDGALNEISSGLGSLAERAGLKLESLSRIPAFVGLAGMTGEAVSERLRTALPFTHVRIEDDRAAALRGALGRADGAIAHCGTGSFFAAQCQGTMRCAGGWGPVLGDEASAHFVGKAALSMTLTCIDGQHPTSPLAERILEDCEGAEGIVRFAGSANPSEFGALAPLVTEFAKQGDMLAEHILRGGARDIFAMLQVIGWRNGQKICLTGGIGPCYAPYLPAGMQSDLTPPLEGPLAGALSLAAEFAQEIRA
ncbi:MAG: ATPase [Boseongicola sp. SB0664_bin_43]|uniref:ATPase n=1 Tax=Boseongicola sp. SB0664_bin_43 TaxID=2604844 RepID=A0A6B0XYE6_9RHOB|nr:ATPase [Boseongicola sp. SB0664_bin_43]